MKFAAVLTMLLSLAAAAPIHQGAHQTFAAAKHELEGHSSVAESPNKGTRPK
ncbi:hypothetical protein ACHAPQ_011519, partial [Fusarium lateritium]